MISDLPQRERVDKINAACRWYSTNKELIDGLRPICIPFPDGVGFWVYQENWDITCWIEKWESKRLSLEDAEAKISGQLRPLFAIVREKLGVNHG